jgi:hypothetical protein
MSKKLCRSIRGKSQRNPLLHDESAVNNYGTFCRHSSGIQLSNVSEGSELAGSSDIESL